MPRGPKKSSPIIRPIVLPIMPALPPPIFLTPNTESIESIEKTKSAIPKVRSKNDRERGTEEVKYSIKKPIQVVGGPGNTGKKLPMMPSNIKNPPNPIKNRSIVYVVFSVVPPFRILSKWIKKCTFKDRILAVIST